MIHYKEGFLAKISDTENTHILILDDRFRIIEFLNNSEFVCSFDGCLIYYDFNEGKTVYRDIEPLRFDFKTIISLKSSHYGISLSEESDLYEYSIKNDITIDDALDKFDNCIPRILKDINNTDIFFLKSYNLVDETEQIYKTYARDILYLSNGYLIFLYVGTIELYESKKFLNRAPIIDNITQCFQIDPETLDLYGHKKYYQRFDLRQIYPALSVSNHYSDIYFTF